MSDPVTEASEEQIRATLNDFARLHLLNEENQHRLPATNHADAMYACSVARELFSILVTIRWVDDAIGRDIRVEAHRNPGNYMVARYSTEEILPLTICQVIAVAIMERGIGGPISG